MNIREDDDEEFEYLRKWLSERVDARETRDPQGIRWFVFAAIGAVLIAVALMVAERAEAQTACEWDSDCITWTLPAKYVTGEALDPARIESYRLETATTAAGPWTTLATIAAPARAYKRRPVSGTNYYRVSVVLTSAVTSDPSVVGSSTAVEPKPESPSLLIVENIGYQLNLGSNNRIYFSRVGSVPIGRECQEGMDVMGKSVIKSRDWLVLDAGKTRPRQVFATCERGA